MEIKVESTKKGGMDWYVRAPVHKRKYGSR